MRIFSRSTDGKLLKGNLEDGESGSKERLDHVKNLKVFESTLVEAVGNVFHCGDTFLKDSPSQEEPVNAS